MTIEEHNKIKVDAKYMILSVIENLNADELQRVSDLLVGFSVAASSKKQIKN